MAQNHINIAGENDLDWTRAGRNPLGAAQTTLTGLHGKMSKEKLNLLQFTARGAAKPKATLPAIVWDEFANTDRSWARI